MPSVSQLWLLDLEIFKNKPKLPALLDEPRGAMLVPGSAGRLCACWVSLNEIKSKSDFSSIMITTVIGLLLPVGCSPRLNSSSASQGRVPRMLIVLGSRMGHFCSIEAMRSTMNEKTSLRSLSSASSTLVWNSPLEIQSFLIASHGWN